MKQLRCNRVFACISVNLGHSMLYTFFTTWLFWLKFQVVKVVRGCLEEGVDRGKNIGLMLIMRDGNARTMVDQVPHEDHLVEMESQDKVRLNYHNKCRILEKKKKKKERKKRRENIWKDILPSDVASNPQTSPTLSFFGTDTIFYKYVTCDVNYKI